MIKITLKKMKKERRNVRHFYHREYYSNVVLTLFVITCPLKSCIQRAIDVLKDLQ